MTAADDSRLAESFRKARKAIRLLERARERNPGDDGTYYEQEKWFSKFRKRYTDAVEGVKEVEELGGDCASARTLLLTYEGMIIGVTQFLAERAALLEGSEEADDERGTIVSATEEPSTEYGTVQKQSDRRKSSEDKRTATDGPSIISATPSFECNLPEAPAVRPTFRLIPEVVVPTLASIDKALWKKIESRSCERCEKAGTKCIGDPGRACQNCVSKKSKCSNVIKPGAVSVPVASGSGSQTKAKARSKAETRPKGMQTQSQPQPQLQLQSQPQEASSEKSSTVKIYTSKKRRSPLDIEDERHLTPLQKRVRTAQEEVEVEATLMADPIDDDVDVRSAQVAPSPSGSPSPSEGNVREKERDEGEKKNDRMEEEDIVTSAGETVLSKTSTKVPDKEIISEMQQQFVSLEAQFKKFSDMIFTMLPNKLD